MSETTHQYGYADAQVRDISTAQLLGQVMFLVAIAIGFCALGTLLGRDIAFGTARICSFAAFGMLLVSSFAGARFRVGAFAMGWLFATALVLGLGLGPVINYYASVEPSALTQAFAGTAATVAGAGALGFVLSKDLARWMRPLSLIVFAACCGTIVWSLFAGSISPWGLADHLRPVGRADRGRLQLHPQARHRERRHLARDRYLRLHREHLRLPAEHLLRKVR